MTDTQRGRDRPQAPHDLTDILVGSLEALAAAGEVDAACRLAGRACAALRDRDPAQWRRFNAFLHRASRAIENASP